MNNSPTSCGVAILRSFQCFWVTKMLAALLKALVLAFNPPPIFGLGTAGGFEFYIQNRGEGGAKRLAEVMQQFQGAVSQSKQLAGAQSLWRATSPLGNPWSLLGYSQVAVLPLIQVADVAGVFGISFAVAAGNAAIAEWWVRGGAAGRGVLAVAAVLGGILVYGGGRLHHASESAPPVAVAVVQGNLDLGAQWKPELYGANLQAYLGMMEEALALASLRSSLGSKVSTGSG